LLLLGFLDGLLFELLSGLLNRFLHSSLLHGSLLHSSLLHGSLLHSSLLHGSLLLLHVSVR
jgi:hypothetical protein